MTKEKSILQRIYRVDSVEAHLNKTNPPELVISVGGTVTTLGWSKGQLSPRVYVTPPTDGIYEFDFEAQPPSGMAGQVLSPISANYSAEAPVGIKGVKVYANQNEITTLI